jgi:hypothetical protein
MNADEMDPTEPGGGSGVFDGRMVAVLELLSAAARVLDLSFLRFGYECFRKLITAAMPEYVTGSASSLLPIVTGHGEDALAPNSRYA